MDLLKMLPEYKGRMVLIHPHQQTDDIVKLITGDHYLYAKDYDKISEHFWGGNAKNTARNLFDYLKANVEYDEEPGKTQTVKSPSAILHEGHGDCKHYGSFVVGVVDSLRRKGYPVSGRYMYVNSKDRSANFHHVFGVVVDANTGKDYWCDPIYNQFDKRKNYLNSKSVDMALYRVSGDLPEIGKKNPKVKKAERKANRQANKQARKENRQARKAERKAINALPRAERKAVKKQKRQQKRAESKDIRKRATGAQRTAHIAMKVPNAISRGSFCTLLKMNAFRMASKIAKKYHADPNWAKDLQVQWHAAGGQWKPLKQAINQGVNVWNTKHAEKVAQIGSADGYVTDWMPSMPWQQSMCNCDSLQQVEDKAEAMGADPYTWASIAAVVAAAMPLIIKLMSLLKKADVDTDQLKEDGMDAGDELIEQYNDSQEYPIDEDEQINYGSDTPQYGMRAYNDPANGNATIEITKSNVNENGDVDYTGSNNSFEMVVQKVKDFAYEHKTALIATGIGIAALKFGPDLIRSVSSKKRR